MTNPFDIEQQFKAYLTRVYGKTPMPKSQYTELRRCFYGSWGQFIVVLMEGIANLPEEPAAQMLADMKNQVGKFFNEETRGQN